VDHVKAFAVGRIRIMTQIFDSPLEAMTQKTGSLIVVTGSMFSGKTEELIRRVRRALYARRSVQVFKHSIDTRSGRTKIRSHSGVPHEATAAATSEELLEKVDETTDVVAIEEAQFFDEGIVEACRDLADAGYEVVATGLDMDFRGEPFGPMPRLLAEADEVVKLRAICARCGRDASRSQRLINGRPAPVSAPTILVGAEESYEARCRHCHEVPEGVFQYGLPGL
jgi:thymidine kinase